MSLEERKRVVFRLLVLTVMHVFVTSVAIAADWNQWHGPNRDGVTSEGSCWPQGWPPKELWRTNVGFGVSSPIIVKDRVYVMGWKDGEDHVYCLDAVGKNGKPHILWSKSYPCPHHSSKGARLNMCYKGPLATPVMDVETGYLYTLSCDGDLRCWEAYNPDDPGKLRWETNLFMDHNVTAGKLDYGFPASPLFYGGWIIVETGDHEQGAIWAFGKSDGKVKWKSAHRGNRSPSSPALIMVEGIPCVATVTDDTFVVVRMDGWHEGESVIEHPWPSRYNESNPSPVVSGNKVLVTMCESSGRRTHLLTINTINKNDFAQKDYTEKFFTCTSTPALNNDHLYFRSGKKVRSFALEEGKMNWESGDIFEQNHPMGAEVGNLIVTAGDNKMIIWDGDKKGNLVLAEASPHSGWKVLARLDGILNKTKYEQGYPSVAFSNSMIVCRNIEGDVVCLSVGVQ
jgi:outer membrane protein assembly factor BamB